MAASKYDKDMALLKNLLDRANHPNTPPEEAELCRTRALKLAAKLSVTEAMAQEHAKDRHIVEKTSIWIPNPHADVMCGLLISICNAVDITSFIVQKLVTTRNGRLQRRLVDAEGWCEVQMYGFSDQLDLVEALHDALFPDFQLKAYAAAKDHPSSVSSKDSLRSFVNAYRIQIESRITQFYTDAIKEEGEGSGKAELVLHNRRNEIDEIVEAEVGKLEKSRKSRYRRDLNAASKGREEGRKADVALNSKFNSEGGTKEIAA